MTSSEPTGANSCKYSPNFTNKHPEGGVLIKIRYSYDLQATLMKQQQHQKIHTQERP